MSTRYTEAIAKDITFEAFAMNCAKGMSPCISMRDDPHDAEIPERFEPSTYHAEAFKKAEAELEKLKITSPDDATILAREEYNQRTALYEKTIQDMDALRVKYNGMLSKCKEWTPPTEEHIGLQKFMIEQITGSIDHDCDTRYYNTSAVAQSGEEWLLGKAKTAVYDIAYYTKMDAEERNRTDARNLWVRELRDSLAAQTAVDSYPDGKE